MSHHLYPNTYHDLEISLFEPWLVWMPQSKTAAQKVFSWIVSPVVYATLFAFGFLNRFELNPIFGINNNFSDIF